MITFPIPLFISLLQSTNSQTVNEGTGGTTGTVIGDLFADELLGSALSGYTVTNPGYQTITVAGGEARIVGTSTVKNLGLAINRTGYGKSTMRSYDVEVGFKINSIGATTFGVIAGVNSQRNTGQNCSTYALFDYSTTNGNLLEIVGGNSSSSIGVTNASSGSSFPAVNTTDTYKLKLSMMEDVVTATLTNVSTSQSKTVSFTYDFTTPYGGNQVKPNIFYYSFGVNGTSDVSFQYFKVSTSEKKDIKVAFLGDSITTGLYGGDADNAYPYKLRPYSYGTVQIMAGGYNKTQDVLDNLPEILMVNPEYAFLMIGTNDGCNMAVFPTLQNIVSQLTTAGVQVICLMPPDGGNPLTSGNWNNAIKTNYPTAHVDTWTTGFNTMNTGNGEMVDGYHPTNAGFTKLANIIKAARPDLFN